MQFLNPKTDFAFKKIFGSDQSHDILLSFLNALLSLQSPYAIAEVTILDPYQVPRIRGMKDTYVDVRAKDENGRQFIIEMQVLNVPGFEQRILHNACKAYAGQIGVGEDYTALADVIALTITDFVMFADREGHVSKFKLRADDGGLYNDDLELVFVELPKFVKTDAELLDVQDKWLYFLKCAKDLTVIPHALEQEQPIVHALNIANSASWTKEEEDEQIKREWYLHDMRALQKSLRDTEMNALARGWKEGEAKGREEGEAKGREEGEAKGREEGRAEGERAATMRLALSLLPLLTDDAIATATGLTVLDVQALRKQ